MKTDEDHPEPLMKELDELYDQIPKPLMKKVSRIVELELELESMSNM